MGDSSPAPHAWFHVHQPVRQGSGLGQMRPIVFNSIGYLYTQIIRTISPHTLCMGARFCMALISIHEILGGCFVSYGMSGSNALKQQVYPDLTPREQQCDQYACLSRISFMRLYGESRDITWSSWKDKLRASMIYSPSFKKKSWFLATRSEVFTESRIHPRSYIIIWKSMALNEDQNNHASVIVTRLATHLGPNPMNIKVTIPPGPANRFDALVTALN
ncbi:hypothetical protein VNO77_02877 [Canavalia gladiata]|uniref:Uncharacterized protein n=1 Tax=Canavalia gladiata TaxID=3824 RepID=A0AAN9R6G9_CANGL